jgi:biotin carboxyl carrier protein
VVCIVEAMKMENEIATDHDGVVAEVAVRPGEPVTSGQMICVVAPEQEE